MKKIYSLVAVLAATLSMNAQTALNVNGSLEDWTDATTQPSGWYISSTNLTNGIVVKSTDGAQDGVNYLKLQNQTAASGRNEAALQDIAVTPGTSYTISYWYKSDGTSFNFKHWAQWRTVLGGGNNIEENITTFQPANSVAASVGQWVRIQVTEIAPATANAIRVSFRNYTGSSFASIDNVMVYEGTASNTQNEIEGLNIFPNPATDLVNVTSNTFGAKQVQLFDMVGKKVLDIETNDVFNVSGLNQGIYVMKVTEAGKTATRKLVIK